ncbi:hypothetical protein QE152_g30467 [Popillia japonica]|uniref:Uncharacterized protein n=1 Tax=Popillia japonica TaxID=7064 RepID=A0AAW1JEN1_POPJA
MSNILCKQCDIDKRLLYSSFAETCQKVCLFSVSRDDGFRTRCSSYFFRSREKLVESGTTLQQHIVILHQNVQSLTNKIEVEIFAEDEKCDILYMSQHWYTKDSIQSVVISGYQLLGHFSRDISLHGSAAVFGGESLAVSCTNNWKGGKPFYPCDEVCQAQ